MPGGWPLGGMLLLLAACASANPQEAACRSRVRQGEEVRRLYQAQPSPERMLDFTRWQDQVRAVENRLTDRCLRGQGLDGVGGGVEAVRR